MAIDKIVAEYRLELDGLRKDFDAVKDQVKSVEETISKSADTGSKKFEEIGNQVSGRLSSAFNTRGKEEFHPRQSQRRLYFVYRR